MKAQAPWILPSKERTHHGFRLARRSSLPLISRTRSRWALFGLTLILASVNFQASSSAFQYGHYFPGIAGIRDFVLPPPGFYYSQYNTFYTTSRLNDPSGRDITSITLPDGTTIGQGRTLNIWAISPTFAWVAEKKILGGYYAAAVVPWFGNTTLGAQTNDFGIISDVSSSNWGIGDWYFMPVMLGWHGDHYDASASYGFWAPTGAPNLTLSTWTNQFQASGYWYPWKNQATAVEATVTFETHTEDINRDFRLGDNLSLEYGISQFFTEWLSLGIAGYGNWQVTENSGRAVLFPGVLSQNQGIGGEILLIPLKDKLILEFTYKYEYLAESRFQGQLSNFTFSWIF